ncbi:MAG: Fe-S cluster assembly protein SufD [Actinomycetota bacterium]|nr:Fe-S cluster assembly protein SufD [Actinomycetota bacterium]
MGFTKTDVEQLSSALSEPGWVTDRRLQAFGYVEKLEMPAERDEPWRYTDLRRMKFKLDKFSVALPSQQVRPVTAEERVVLEQQADRAGYVIQRDSDIALRKIEEGESARGVIFTDLGTAIVEHADLVKQHLFSEYQADLHVFNALHAAFFSGGTFVYVPRGVTVALPLESHRWIDKGGIAVFPHTLIVVEEGAEVTYFERFESLPIDSASLSIGGSEIIAGPASRVWNVMLQEHGADVWRFDANYAALERDVSFHNLVVSLGGRFNRHESSAIMRGDGAGVDMLGLYLAGSGQHFDFRTLQDHAAAHGTSDLLYKGALKDDAHTVYSGLIHVRPNGLETDAYQTNRNLVLSDHAKADSKPELEIENNDVRCSHGASVGQMNEEELFYLQSRGISRSEAERLVVEGFFQEVIARVSNAEVRELLTGAIDRKLAV